MRLFDFLNFKDPRWIQGCPKEFTVDTGRWTHALAKDLRKRLIPTFQRETNSYSTSDVRAGRQVVYTSGMTAEQIGNAYARALSAIARMCDVGENIVVIEDDQSRFDMHIGMAAFGFLDKVYAHTLPAKIRNLLKRNWNVGRSKHGTRYGVRATVTSGKTDTSISTTSINIAMKIYIHGPGGKWITIVCGDDSVTITTDRELARLGGRAGLIQAYAALGMEVEVIIREDPLEAEFCSQRFYRAGGSFVLMPKIGKLLAKLSCDLVDRSPVNQKAWLRGISESLLVYGKVDPLCAAFGEAISRSVGVGKVVRGERNDYAVKLSGRISPKLHDVYEHYLIHYRLSTSEVDEAIASLRSFTLGGTIISPVVCEMIERDL
jgi:hypothetical protein